MKKNNTEQFIKKLSEEIVENSEILVYSDNMKSAKELLSLQKYLIKNPEQRFWQGLINWAGFNIKALATKILGKKSKKDSVYNPIQCAHIYKYSHQERKQTNSTGCNETVYDVVVCEKCGDVKRNQTFNY